MLNKTLFFTKLILYANVIMFLLLMFTGAGFVTFNTADLLAWGGNFGPRTLNGEYWRLLTSMFLHGGIMHLVMNMIGFVFVGAFMEPVIGNVRFAIIYLGSGICAGLASAWWHDATVSVGASGAIFGLYGAVIAFVFSKVYSGGIGKVLLVAAAVFVAYNLLMGAAGNGIDNAAHFGGLVSGFIIGRLLFPSAKTKTQRD